MLKDSIRQCLRDLVGSASALEAEVMHAEPLTDPVGAAVLVELGKLEVRMGKLMTKVNGQGGGKTARKGRK